MNDAAISVRQLNLYVKSLIEGDVRLNLVSVKGEISNFKNHFASGHWYFTLKDNDASIRCVMFKWSAQNVAFDVSDGMEVVLIGRVSLYEKDGQYQFYAENMHSVGSGDLALQFNKTKEKLEKEGLFREDTKRPLPKMPKRIAVITSETGAAVHDVLNILNRRCPACEIVFCPASVQGETAPKEMAAMLERVYSLSDIDLIIIGRGGGSAEDLSAFNSEMLARKIYESPIPVISAVGHETDFTICDFVADLRAPTPSAAAEIAVPDMQDLLLSVLSLKNRLRSALLSKYKFSKLKYDAVISKAFFRKPGEITEGYQREINLLRQRMALSVDKITEKKKNEFTLAVSKIDSLSPLKIMARGYISGEKDGKIVKSVKELSNEDLITLSLFDGKAECLVKEINL